MQANKNTIKEALKIAKKAKYPVAANRGAQNEPEWRKQQDEIIETLKELLK